MKRLQVLGLVLIASACSAVEWKDFKSPLESRSNKASISQLYSNAVASDVPITGRITNGSPAALGQFPYQVYMYLYDAVANGFLCGGSVIHEQWILTAAHCVQDIVKVEVFLGGISRLSGVGQPTEVHVVTRAKSIIVHPNYDNKFKDNDIGLVELPRTASFSSYISAIALPVGVEGTRNLIGLQATVSGYGRTTDQSQSASAVLNYVTLPIINNSVCAATFGSPYVNDKHVCLQSNANLQSGCNGDSGGPLTVAGTTGGRVLVGVVSYGAAAGCEMGFPQVFTRVSSHITWIEQSTGLRFS